MELLLLLVANLAAIVATGALVRWDEARLEHDELARAWPVVTRRIAVVFFAPFSLVIHFGRTRRSARGLCLGLLWTCAVVLLEATLTRAIEVLFDNWSLVWP